NNRATSLSILILRRHTIRKLLSYYYFSPTSSLTVSSNLELIIGIKDRSTSEEIKRAKEMVSAKSQNRKPAMPGTNKMGIKTTSVVRVEITTGTATSWAPNIEASLRS